MTRNPPSTASACPCHRGRGGFSLVELTLVAAIVAAGAAVAVPRYTASLSRARLAAAASQVIAHLDFARERAIATSAEVTVVFEVDLDSLEISGLPVDASGVGGLGAAAGPLDLSAEPFGVTLASADFGGESSVRFDAWGRVAVAGAAVLRLGNGSKTVQVPAGDGRAEAL